jgi:anion-transporting  ArsA/GET3 family ATPase
MATAAGRSRQTAAPKKAGSGGSTKGAKAAGRAASDWEGVRLHVVTGKGGTGKTTVAAALALALAAEGRRTLLIEVEGRQGIAELFGIAALPYEERKIAAVAPPGQRAGGSAGEVYALAIDTELALLEYLDMFYKLGRAGKALRKVGFIDFATTIAPGLRDVLLTGKACEAARRKGPDGRPYYDAVVMDAPPTGRIARFLNVNTEVAGLARFGPIHTQAQAVMKVLKSPQTAVHLVTLLEEMPVQETVDGVAELRAAGLPVGGVIVNMVRPPLLDRAAVDSVHGDQAKHEAEIAEALTAAGLGGRGGRAGRGGRGSQKAVRALVGPLLAEGRAHASRVELEREQRTELDHLGLPSYQLPLQTEGPEAGDLGGLYRLAGELTEQGAA